jgi:hypothetical protein
MASSSWFSPSEMMTMTRLPSLPDENDWDARSMAAPMAVPCLETMVGEMLFANVRAMT